MQPVGLTVYPLGDNLTSSLIFRNGLCMMVMQFSLLTPRLILAGLFGGFTFRVFYFRAQIELPKNNISICILNSL